MSYRRPNLLALLVALIAAKSAYAEIISQALLSFPSQTQYLEYDNLATLRTRPDYPTLRQRFSGKPLEDARITLRQLEIRENQVQEVVSGASATAFYVLAAGMFSEASAKRHGAATRLLNTHAYCPGKSMCVVFLEDSLAALGTLSELKDVVQAHQGITSRLSSNRNAVTLMNGTDRLAPVRGILFGGQLSSSVSDMLKDSLGWNRDWSGLSSNITAIGYSVRFDSMTHVSATLDCTSRTSATVLVQMLNALSALQPANMPLRNLRVSANGSVIDLKADTPLPTAAASSKTDAARSDAA
jgi:hypothetical protein